MGTTDFPFLPGVIQHSAKGRIEGRYKSELPDRMEALPYWDNGEVRSIQVWDGVRYSDAGTASYDLTNGTF